MAWWCQPARCGPRWSRPSTGFEFPVVVFDAPADLREADQVLRSGCRRAGWRASSRWVRARRLAIRRAASASGRVPSSVSGISRLAGRIRRAVIPSASLRSGFRAASGPSPPGDLAPGRAPAASVRSLQCGWVRVAGPGGLPRPAGRGADRDRVGGYRRWWSP